MRIDSLAAPVHLLRTTVQKEPPEPPGGKKEDTFWREFGNDVRELLLHADQQKLQDAGQLIKTLGNAVRNVWKLIRHVPDKIMDVPAIKDNVDEEDRLFWSNLTDKVGLAAGFTAAGGQAVMGCTKLVSGFREGHTGRKLDGLVDLATATTLAVTVAGLGAVRLVAAPIAASINSVRGGFNAITGFKQNDERKQLQGMLDLTRSIGGIGRIFRSQGLAFNIVGIGFAPVAGALQAGRGLYDVSIGLKNDDKKKVVRGLVDVATAVGTTLAFASGVAVIPGVVLAVAANIGKAAYQLSPKFRGVVDKRLDKLEPKLETLVHKATDLSAPLVRGWKRLMGKLIDKIDATGPEQFSKAQLADITLLMHADGLYSREENRRIRTELEDGGQGNATPKLDAPPPASMREVLLRELNTPARAREFVGFMLVVANYDFKVTPEEDAFVRHLADQVGIPKDEFETMAAAARRKRLEWKAS